jgi:hypothetical protein
LVNEDNDDNVDLARVWQKLAPAAAFAAHQKHAIPRVSL